MTSPLERLADLTAEPPDAKEFAGLQGHEIRNRGEYEGDLEADERIVKDLIAACKAVAAALEKLEAPK
jgi:hypothetical protein